MVGGGCGSGCAWQGGMCGRGACMAGACMVVGACVAGEMATAAEGTHLIGMLSCCLSIYNFHNNPY